MKKKKLMYLLGCLAIAVSAVAGVTYAAFTDKAKVLGSTFSVGSANLMFLEDLALGTDPSNYRDELPGPTFSNVGPGWTEDYLVKLISMATSKIGITTTAYYETANDPNDLRSITLVEIIKWYDTNQNGILDEGEEGQSLGQKTIIKWKTEGFNLGELFYGQTMGLILRFSTPTVSDTKQGASAVFDFEFNSIQM
ncbi:SipW-dependent-type signal peptide-containing protein [Patescibacteria group bacterium]|nr:SipW-dependent-type signal peptide-containing protein [Patescibacteria group bacterium]